MKYTKPIMIGAVIFVVIAAILVWKKSTTNTETELRSDNRITLNENITLSIPSNFGIVPKGQDLPPLGYIPACDETFDYCFYYNDNQFNNTNFESAGVKFLLRNKLNTSDKCLTEQPDGYSELVPELFKSNDFSTAYFTNLGDAAAGHSSTGGVYRLFYNDSCYEFETRLGTSRFENYEPGLIQEFTADDQRIMNNLLTGIVNSVELIVDPNQTIFVI